MRLTLTRAAPPADADGDHPQLLDRDALDFLDRGRVNGVLDGLGNHDHRVHEQAGQYVEILAAPGVQPGEPGQVDRQLRSDQPDFGADRVAQHCHAAGAFTADEAPVFAIFVDAVDEDV